MNIPEEALDAAAEFLFIDYSVTPYYRDQLRAALEAAAPHILAPFAALANEWSVDAEKAEHYVDHGYGAADGVREAKTLGEGADRIREIMRPTP